jgi:hypothetical protein
MLGPATLVQVSLNGSAGLITPEDLSAQVTAELSNLPLTVKSSVIAPTSSLLSDVLALRWDWTYTAVLVVATPSETYADALAVGQAVAGAFEDVTGMTPSAVQTKLVGHAPTLGAPTPSAGVTDWLSGIGSTLHGDVLLFVLLLTGLVALLIYTVGPGVKVLL